MEHTEKNEISRGTFLKGSGALLAASVLPMSLVELSCGKGGSTKEFEKFTFAFISDSHLTQIQGSKFVNNYDRGLQKAVAEVNFLSPKPDFVVYGGDLAQLGKKEEIDHGMDILSGVTLPKRFVIGEHDYYLDMGEYWQKKVSDLNYSFDHKGVHFVVLNSILTHQEWLDKWSKDPMGRMKQMARLDNPNGTPFMVGDPQIEWMKKDLSGLSNDTPLVILSHSPLYKIFKPWNFWTDDAESVQSALSRFNSVTVFHGHVHQILYNAIGNIKFFSLMSTGWPWPYPNTYSQKDSVMPKLTVPMNRADPFHERDATGWSFVNTETGKTEHNYQLWNNENRQVYFDSTTGKPVDRKFQDEKNQILPQTHY